MELQHINVKVFVDGELPVDPGRFINVFHGWIQEKKDLGCLLIDVADYGHVPSGPGVLLIGLEADYSMDQTGGRWGLRYNRKSPLSGTNEDRFREALSSAARACLLMEKQFAAADSLKFGRSEFELFINDRALAPNTPQTFSECKPDLEAFIRNRLAQTDFKLRHDSDSRKRFSASILLSKPVDFDALVRSS